MSKQIKVFDPPMCCDTGICGPDVDPKLTQFAADLDWLKDRGVDVSRFNLSQEPQAFVDHPPVQKALDESGNDCLPLMVVDGEIRSEGKYPSRQELSNWVGLDIEREQSQTIFTESVAELVAIGAAIASNCKPCFKFHYDKARNLGVSRKDMLKAVQLAEQVKETPAEHIHDLAMRYVGPDGDDSEKSDPANTTGCGTDSAPEESSGGGCC